MKLKIFAGLTLTLFLLITLFSAIPVKPTPGGSIKVGVIGPMPWIQGQGMREGAEIAWDEIGRKISIGGVDHDVELVFADTLRGKPDPDAETGRAAALELMAADCDFLLGGFRTEAVLSAREVFMDYKKIYMIAGAATNELIDCSFAYKYPLVPPPNPCCACVRCCNSTVQAMTGWCAGCAPNRYKYMFRATPINSSILVKSIATFIQKELTGYWLWNAYTLGTCMGYPAMYKDLDASCTVTAGDERATPVCLCADGVTPTLLLPGIVQALDCDIGAPLMKLPMYQQLTKVYGEYLPGNVYADCVGGTPPYLQVKVGIISEALVWADVIHIMLTHPLMYPSILGPFANVTYAARISPVTTDVSAELEAARLAGCHAVVEVISGPAGRAFASQWRDASGPRGTPTLRAIAEGIDVPGQEIPTHWALTMEKCETESFLCTAGQRTPINYRTVALYDETMKRYGHAPIYTSYGAYDALIGLKENLEAWGGPWPPASQAAYDSIIPVMEATYRPLGIVGKFRYTAGYGVPSAPVPGTYMSLHDVYSTELDEHWAQGYVRALHGQWQKHPVTGEGRLEVVYPYLDTAAPFAKKYKFPDWMYRLWEVDIDTDGDVDGVDVSFGQGAWLTVAGDPLWNRKADMDGNYHINVVDISRVTYDWGDTEPIPYATY